MSYEYSEDLLIEQTSMDIFFNDLGWDVNNAFDKETFGEPGSLGRYTNSDVVLVPRLLKALKKLNPDLPDEAYKNSVEQVLSEPSFMSMVDINKQKYDLYRNGVKVSFKNDKGELVKDKTLQIFDFENAKENDFLAVQQLWVQGKTYLRRPDIIGFVNGIPLLFIELKAVHKNLLAAYEGNLSDYKDTIPNLFHHNAFIMLSNGIDTKVGSITSKYEHFHEWKRITENEKGVVSLDTTLKGVCDKQRFMDLFESFILFDDSVGKTIKLVARNHQYLGVNSAIKSVRDMKKLEGRLGVFWHTQGSGKSYSMIFFGQKIHRKLSGSYTILVVTDRDELDKQIYGTFTGIGAVTNPDVRAKSGKHLRKLLTENHRYIFSLIHKFNEEGIITDNPNIIIFSDEAHRTQQGTLALNMRNAIPNASFIGFTGTPLMEGEDEVTKDIFGDYVSIYNFQRSYEDNSTVRLFYENRGEYLGLENPEINKEMRKVVEESDLDPDQEEKLKRLFYKDYPILTAEKRLRAIARDLVWHFNERGYKGKGMFVALDKITAVRMYNYIAEYWHEYIDELKSKSRSVEDEQELIEQQRELDWAVETEICVVVSAEQNEVDKFRKWDLEIESHRIKMKKRDLERDFKDADHPFRLVIVCAMWLTGFDVPSLSTLYLDKPMKGHNLMQTIARANRVYEEKNNGLIVDYIETYQKLLEALAIYGPDAGTDTGGEIIEKPPIDPKDRLLQELEELLSRMEENLQELSFNLSDLISANGLQKIAQLENGVNAVCVNDESKIKFQIIARKIFVKYKAIMPDKRINNYKSQKNAIQAIFNRIESEIESADVSEVMKKIQEVVDKSVFTILEPTEDYGTIIDISHIDFDALLERFKKNSHKNKSVQLLKKAIEMKLAKMMAQNPFRADYQSKYNEIIEEYNSGKDAVTIEKTFKELLNFTSTLGEEQQRVIREGLNEEQMAVFDILLKDKLNKTDRDKVKKVAVKLLDILKSEKLKIDNWREKAEISAKVRTDILNKLYEDLPYPAYATNDIDSLTNSVYWYVWNRYPNVKYVN